jgi:hypothetical protein
MCSLEVGFLKGGDMSKTRRHRRKMLNELMKHLKDKDTNEIIQIHARILNDCRTLIYNATKYYNNSMENKEVIVLIKQRDELVAWLDSVGIKSKLLCGQWADNCLVCLNGTWMLVPVERRFKRSNTHP